MTLEQIKEARAEILKRANRVKRHARGGGPEQVYTPDDTLRIAKRCESFREFKTDYPAAHRAAIAHKTISQIKETLPARVRKNFTRIGRWSKEAALKEAQLYTKKIQFCTASKGAYSFLDRTGLLDEACAHMRKNEQWSKESALEEALKYNSLSKYRLASSGAYYYCRRKNILDEASAHMTSGHKKHWTKCRILKEAGKHSVYADFKAKAPEAYASAMRLNMIEELKSLLKG